MTTQNTDYDAAQALLDLQGTVKQENPGAYVWRASNSREDMEKTAKLFWNCFISSEIPMVSVSTSDRNETITKSQEKTNAEFPNTSKPFENFTSNKTKRRFVSKLNVLKHYRNFDSKNPKGEDSTSAKSSQKLPILEPLKNCNCKNTTKATEMATQTEECYFNPNIEFMENTIKKLTERIQSLEAQLKQSLPEQDSVFTSSDYEDNQAYGNRQSMDYNMSTDENTINGSKTIEYSKRIKFEKPHDFEQDNINEYNNKVKMNPHSYPNTSDMVPIGDGYAAVPARLLKHINWNSYTSATRKLLSAMFSRRILATHSLTGKPSPAFPNKPAKKRLDPAIVNDIVQTVVERCSVPENVVRTSITTKCADESKMFKTRQSNKKRRTSKKNCENVPPTTSESEDC